MQLTREQILAFRQRTNHLGQRLGQRPDSLRRAAWAGLTDSVPRAALLSLQARHDGVTPNSWEDDALVQVWGPRFSAYVVAVADAAVFTLGRLPTSGKQRQRAEGLADRLRALLGDRRVPYGEAGRALGVNPNELRYATLTGTVRIRWDGARQPTIWTAPPPDMDEQEARRELARRHLHVLGPSTPESFGKWAGVRPAAAQAVFEDLDPSLIEVRTPIGQAWILAGDEDAFRQPPTPAAPARLLPSGDAYYLCWGADRDLLVPDPARRDALWTSRVWPGAVMAEGDLVGTWRRSQHKVTIQPWQRLSDTATAAVDAEATALPIPDLDRPIDVTWEDG